MLSILALNDSLHRTRGDSVVGKTNALILQESLGFLTGVEKVGAFREDDDHACGLQGAE